MYFLVLQSTFDAFDVDKKGYIGTEMIGTIMDMLGTQLDPNDLEVRIFLIHNLLILKQTCILAECHKRNR